MPRSANTESAGRSSGTHAVAKPPRPTTYELLRSHGISRRDFLQFCTATAAAIGLDATLVPKVVQAMESRPRIPVMWLHGLECTCCSESFIRSSHPIAQDSSST